MRVLLLLVLVAFATASHHTCRRNDNVVHVPDGGFLAVSNASTAPANILACTFIVGLPGRTTSLVFTGARFGSYSPSVTFTDHLD